MFCPNCGHEIKINETFCSNCGAKIVNGKAVFDKPKPATVVHAEQDKENAIVSLVCGIASLIIPYLNIVLGIVAIVFAKKVEVNTNFSKAGRTTGICGIVLGSLYIILSIVWIVLVIMASGSATY